MKSKRIAIIALLAMFSSLGVSAQNVWREKGYRFDVSLAATLPNQWEAATSHGYGFGNGLFLGGGAAFHYDGDAKDYMTPVFGVIRYSPLRSVVSPYVEAKCGAVVNISRDLKTGFYFNPSIGVDIWHFSIFGGYEMNTGFRNGWKVGLALHF